MRHVILSYFLGRKLIQLGRSFSLRIRLAKNIYHAYSCGSIRISRPGYLFVDCRYECGSVRVISLRLTDKIVACIP